MRRTARVTLGAVLVVCISVCAGFTLPDRRAGEEDPGWIAGRVDEIPTDRRTLEGGAVQPGVEYRLIQDDAGLNEILRHLSRSVGDANENVSNKFKRKDFDAIDVKLIKEAEEIILRKLRREKKFIEFRNENKDEEGLKTLSRADIADVWRRFRRDNTPVHSLRGRDGTLNDLRRLRRSEGTSADLRLRREGEDRGSEQVDGQVGGRLISSRTGRVDPANSVAAILGTDSLSRKPAHSHLSASQQVNREVDPKHRQHTSSAYRLLNQGSFDASRIGPKNFDPEIFPKKLEESETLEGRKVIRDELVGRRVIRDGGNKVGRSEALAQEVSKVSDHPNTVPKMVVVATTTLAALFGMCVMAAIFQCCCRRKRAASDSETVDGVKSASNDKKSSKSPSPEKDTNKPDRDEENTENDKLLEDEDLGDFSAVQRETEILKSFRKPPPPKNRARASRVPRMKAAASTEDAFSLIKEEAEGSIKSKSGSQRDSPGKTEDTDNKLEEAKSPESPKQEEKISSTEAPKELIEPPKAEDKRLSFEAAKQMVDSMLAEVREKGETTLMAKGETTLVDSEPEEKVKEKETANVNGVSAMGGNIFMQIDPTVKIEDPSEKKTSRIPVRATPSSPSSASKQESSLRPTSANKDQRKFLVPSIHGEQMDQLVKSLKTKLKEDKGQTCLSDRNLATSKPMCPGSEDGMEPVGRERSHSDPTKKLLGVKATHV